MELETFKKSFGIVGQIRLYKSERGKYGSFKSPIAGTIKIHANEDVDFKKPLFIYTGEGLQGDFPENLYFLSNKGGHKEGSVLI